jgi:DNA-binding transcriptional regulator/RsmH inhibitor MraZ
VLTAEGFEEVANEMLDKVKRGVITRSEQRALAAATVEATVDAQGRVTIDRELLDFAGIEAGTKVTVAGSFDRVEIWEPGRYERMSAAGGAAIRGGAA